MTCRADNVKHKLKNRGLGAVLAGLAAEYRVSQAEIVGLSKNKRACVARQHLWLLIRDSLNLTYEEIAQIFQRKHSNILMGIRKHRERIEREMGA